MTIGILCAIPQELTHLEQALRDARVEERAGMRFSCGILDGREVVLVGAGIGKVNTAMSATLLADRFGADPILFSGVAGGLDPNLHIGDVVIAERTLQHDCGWIKQGRFHVYQAGHVPFFNPTERLGFEVPGELLGQVRQRLEGFALPALSRRAGGEGTPARIVFGTILSGDQYVGCEATRDRLHRELGGQAVEMEGGALAQVCEAFGVGWLDIRALSDLAGHDAPFDFHAFVEEVAASSALIVRHLLPVL